MHSSLLVHQKFKINLAILKVKTNSDLSRSYSTTVPLNIGRAMDVNIGTLIHQTINSGGCATLYLVESEVPPLTAARASLNARVSHVNNTEACIAPLFSEIAFLKRRYISDFTVTVCCELYNAPCNDLGRFYNIFVKCRNL